MKNKFDVGLLTIALLPITAASPLKAKEYSVQTGETLCQDVSEDNGKLQPQLKLWATKPVVTTTFEESVDAGKSLLRQAGSATRQPVWFAKTVAMDLNLEQVRTAGNVLAKRFNPALANPPPVLRHTFSTGPRKDEVVRKYASWSFEAKREIFSPESQDAVVNFSFSMCSLKGTPEGWAGMRVYYLNEAGQRMSYHDVGRSDLDTDTRGTCRRWGSGSFRRQLKAQDFARLAGITIVAYGQDYRVRVLGRRTIPASPDVRMHVQTSALNSLRHSAKASVVAAPPGSTAQPSAAEEGFRISSSLNGGGSG